MKVIHPAENSVVLLWFSASQIGSNTLKQQHNNKH